MSYTDFEKDCQLIDKLIVLDAGLSNDPNIIKQAGVVDILGGVFNTIKQTVQERIQKEGVAGALATYLGSGALFHIWKPLGIIAFVAEAFGFSLGSILNSAKDMAIQMIESKGSLSEQDVDNIANASVQTISTQASLEPLRELEKQGMLFDALSGKLIKEARPRFKSKGGGGLRNIFLSLGKGGKARALLGGLVRWIIRAVLFATVGFGLTESANVVKKTLTDDKTSTEEAGEGSGTSWWGSFKSKSQPQGYNLPPNISHKLQPSGAGDQYHINKGNTIWMVKLVNNDIRQTLLFWAKEIYPQLRGHDQEILNSAPFNTMVSNLHKTYDPQHSPMYLSVLPNSGLHTWKEVVDRFAGDVASKLKGTV